MANEETNKIPPIIHHATPKFNGCAVYDNNHVYATCLCPVDTRYGLMINLDDLTEHEKEIGKCRIHCDNCGADIIVHFKPVTTALHGLRANMAYIDEYVFPITNTESED